MPKDKPVTRTDKHVRYTLFGTDGEIAGEGRCAVHSTYLPEPNEFQPTHVELEGQARAEVRYSGEADSSSWPVYEFARDPWAVISLDKDMFDRDTGYANIPF